MEVDWMTFVGTMAEERLEGDMWWKDDDMKDAEEKEPGMSAKAEMLSEALSKQGDGFENGDVIRWSDGGYTFAAVRYTNDKWALTGTGRYYDRKMLSTNDILKILAEASGSVEIATMWERAK